MIRAFALPFFAAISFAASEGSLELRGQITGSENSTALRVQLFSVETPYTASAGVDMSGAFRFRDLRPGNYTVAVVRSGLGEIRRTVVVGDALADADGVVRVEIPYSAAEAALGKSGVTVSLRALAVPEEARKKYLEAQERLALRETESAIRAFQEAASIAPQYASAWNALGVIAFQEGDLEGAESQFRRALEAEVSAFEPSMNLGGLLLRSGRTEEALAYNQRAAADRPMDAAARAQLGMNYFRLGRLAEAEEHLLAAKRVDPAIHLQPQLFLADIYIRRGDEAAALAELEELLARRPDGPNAETIRQAIAKLRE